LTNQAKIQPLFIPNFFGPVCAQQPEFQPIGNTAGGKGFEGEILQPS
jgi:hypothetical protein